MENRDNKRIVKINGEVALSLSYINEILITISNRRINRPSQLC